MTKTIITKLTAEQEAQIPVIRDEFLRYGLSTEAADFEAAEQAVRDAYAVAGLPAPKIFIRLASPYEGAIGAAILNNTRLGESVRAQVWAQARDQVGAQVWDQARAQVWDQVRDQVWAQVWAQVRAQVGDQVRDQVWAQVGDQARAQVGAQVWAQVWDQVRAQARDQVGAQVGDQVRDQVWAQVRDQVRAQVGDQVWDQVGTQVWDQARAQVGAQVRDQVWDQVWAQVRDQVRAQVGDQVWDQVWAQVWAQVRAQVGDQVRDQVWAQVGDQARAQVGAQVGDQVRDQVWAQVRDQVRAQVGDQVWDQVGTQVWDQVWAQVGDQVRAQVGTQVGDQVGAAFYGQHDAGFLGWSAYFSRVCKLPGTEKIEPLARIAANCGWVWFFSGAAIITDRPRILRRDEQNRLHCENGPAIEYQDGFSIYAWHGTRLPKDWVEGRETIDPAEILKAENVEQRAAGAAMLGWPRMVSNLERKIIDGDPETEMGALIELTLPGLRQPGRFLQARCPRNGSIVEGLPRVSDIDGLPINTVLAAQAYRVGDPVSEYIHPEIRT